MIEICNSQGEKNTIRDGVSTYTTYTAYSLYTVYTVYTAYTAFTAYATLLTLLLCMNTRAHNICHDDNCRLIVFAINCNHSKIIAINGF